MTINAPALPFSGNMDVDEFMEFLETRPEGEHWELIEGVAVMMAPASYAHQRIASNFCNLLNSAFAAQRLDLYAYTDVGIRNTGVRNFQPEPDAVVVPGVSGYDLYSERYQLVAEVLSPSNTRREIDLKLGAGQSLCCRDRAARVPGGDSCEEPQLAADDAGAGRRPDRRAGVPPHVPGRRSLPRHAARSAEPQGAIAQFSAHSRESGNPEGAAKQAGSPLSRGRADERRLRHCCEREIVEALRRIGMLGAEHLLPDR
jgi:hypothetical protein